MIQSYHDLPVGLYLDICKVAEDDTLDDLSRQVKVIALLSGKSEDEVLDMPITDYQKAAAASSFLMEPYEPARRIASSYKVGGFDLRPLKDWTKMTTAQFIDYKTFTGKGIEECMVEIVSIFLVPEGHKYNSGYDITDVHAAVRDHLPVADVLDLTAFFFAQFSLLLKDSLTSLKRRLSTMEPGPERERLATMILASETRLGSAMAGSTT